MYTLYNVKRWGSMGPHFLLEELDVPYQSAWMTPEQVAAPDFKALSPLGYIPVLKLDDGSAIFESAAIVVFLTSIHQDRNLAPAIGTPEHGQYLAWLAYMSANIYPTINLAYQGQAVATSEEMAQALRRRASERSLELFDIVEERLSRDGPFILGDQFSAADLYLFMLTVWEEPGEGAIHKRCPRIAELCAQVRSRPKLRAALEVHGVAQPAKA